MPDPDPQPPQPRPVSPACWLLMLLPSVVMIGAPLVGVLAYRLHRYIPHGVDFTFDFIGFVIAVPLSFFLGFRLEKWRGGDLRDWSNPLCFGSVILILNCIISFAGCTALSDILL